MSILDRARENRQTHQEAIERRLEKVTSEPHRVPSDKNRERYNPIFRKAAVGGIRNDYIRTQTIIHSTDKI